MICLSTCDVYQAIYLEIITILSHESLFKILEHSFLEGGVPKLYTPLRIRFFFCAANVWKAIDWNEIIKRNILKKIEWHFNPPSAPL